MARRFDVVAYLKLFRFPLVFTAIADSAAGYLVVRGHGAVEAWVLGLLAAASSGLYCFGMAMNDIADRERDRELAPTRVLPSGRISLSNARYAALIALMISGEAVIWLGLTGYFAQVIFPWCVAVLCILCYDFGWLKVPPVMGLVRVSNFMLGITVGISVGYLSVQTKPWEGLVYGIPEFIYVTALTYVSTLEDGEINRVKVAIGAGGMMLASFLASSLFVIWSDLDQGAYHYYGFRYRWPWMATGVSCLLGGWILFRALRARDRKGVMLMVRDGIGGIILLNASLVMSGTSETLWGLGIAALIIPAVTSVAIFKRLA